MRVRAEVAETNTAEVAAVKQVLADLAGIDPDDISFSAVGPSWGAQITSKAQRALIVFFVVIAVYIWLRMEWKMALAALVAVGHDILVTVGFYALFGFEVTPATVIAFLTILGYSLYDTLVVFDKIRENARTRKDPYFQIVTRSVNEVFMRSVNTTITSVMPILSILIIGVRARGGHAAGVLDRPAGGPAGRHLLVAVRGGPAGGLAARLGQRRAAGSPALA